MGPDAPSRLNAALEGRYRIERQLGEGGMATVYLADDLRHERKVALKVLKPELAAVVGADRFLAEIKTTANLQHPHILPLFDSGEADSFLFYVMPYVEGESLRERLDREHQLPVDEAVTIATKVAGALQAAHERGVIHRDIKPANILLSKGEPLVSDFGIALALGAAGGGRLTETGLSLGTPHYMSPEQATGDLNVGAATDTYALGCVLYEMLVGEPPYTGGTPQAVLGKIVTGKAPSASAERSSVPSNVDAAIRRALEKVPADRFASARESAQALGDPSFRHGLEPAGAGTGTTASRWTTTALLAAALAVGAIGSAVATGAFAPDEPERLIRLPIDLGEDSLLGMDGPEGAWPRIGISPTGNLIAYTGQSSDDSGPQLYLQPLDQLVATPLAGTEGGTNPFFSPDGQWLGFIDPGQAAGSELYRISILGGAPVLVAEAEGVIPGASWGADEQIIFAAVGPSGFGLFRVAAGGGEPERLTDPENSMHLWPSIIDGREAVLFTVRPVGAGGTLSPEPGQIAVLDLASREVTPLGLNGFGARYVSSGHLVYAAPDGSIRAVRFDTRSLEVTGSPVPLVRGVAISPVSGGANFSVSAEGTLIYASGSVESSGETWALVWVDRDGTEELLPLEPRAYYEPRLARDGRLLATGVAAGGRTDLWVYNVFSGAGQMLSEHDAINSWPVWHPDGSLIYFSSTLEAAGGPFGNIYSVPSNGSGPPVRMMPTNENHVPTDVTPDGRMLIYTDVFTEHWEIMGVPTDGSGDPVPLVDGRPSQRGAATISPDGRWIAYRSAESGTGDFEVYVEPYPGPGARVPVSIGGGREPLWSTDGSQLYYRRGDDMLMGAEIEGEATPEVIRRTELFSLAPYGPGRPIPATIHTFHVAPDGRFLMMRRAERADTGTVDLTPELVMVLNWFEELEARVPVD